MTLESTKLSNGLRIVTDTVNTVDSVAVGIWCDVGTRHEDLAYNGVSHMVEHMMFNGTLNRTAQDIVEEVESVGGQMNAYTSREETAYYIHLLKDHLPLALEVLSDMIQHPAFPDNELEKERGVIVQEIGMSNDTPDDLIFDLYQATAYPNQALGAPILGTSKIIESIKKETLLDYVKRFYTPNNLVISAAGQIKHDEMVKQCEKLFSDLPPNQSQNFKPADYKGGEIRSEKDLEQTHWVIGFQSVEKRDAQYFSAMLLSTILGGGMSSRLFQEVREKRGLVYSVYASNSAYKDDGQFEIYAGTGPDKLHELVPVVCNEIKKIINDYVGEEELERAKNQIKSSILMGRESMLSRANRQAKYMINFDQNLDISKILSQIESVNTDDIMTIGQKIFSARPTVAALGPLKNLESYPHVQSRLAA